MSERTPGYDECAPSAEQDELLEQRANPSYKMLREQMVS